MISKFIDDIRKNMDFLYEKHHLFVECVEVSKFIYIEMQRDILQLVGKNVCDFQYEEPLKIDGVPIVINDNLNYYDYKLVASIPSYRFNYKD